MRVPLALALAAGLLLAPGASARPLDKIDARLHDLATGKRVKPKPGSGGATVQPAGAPVRGGRVLVDVYVRGAMRPAAAALRNRQMRIAAISRRRPERMVEGWMPVFRLPGVARLRSTKAILA